MRWRRNALVALAVALAVAPGLCLGAAGASDVADSSKPRAAALSTNGFGIASPSPAKRGRVGEGAANPRRPMQLGHLAEADRGELPRICARQPQLCVPSDVRLIDRYGRVIHERRLDPTRRRLAWTPLAEISPALVTAVVASEDRRFWDHGGVDLVALASAALEHLTRGGRRGASTITMQLAALLDPRAGRSGGRRTLEAKWRQMRAAWDLERQLSKPEILEAYLNLATYRGELQGIAAASAILFDKAPHGVTDAEAVVLASLLRSPNAAASLVERRATRLAKVLSIDTSGIPAIARQALTNPRGHGPRHALAPHVAAKLLTRGRGTEPVHSTLDADVQALASETLERHLLALRGSRVHDGAVLVVDNASGDVLAYVGSSGDLASARHVDGVRAHRQAGSTLKPLLYALAIEQRFLTAASLLEDKPLEIAVAGGLYRPHNYDERFRGLVSVRTALAASINVPAVRTLQLVGGDSFLRRLRQLGFRNVTQSADYYGPSLALGSADVSLWELVGAYRALARRGVWGPLHLEPKGRNSSEGTRVYSAAAAFVVSSILADRGSRSGTFGLDSPLATRFWSAVKTGTSKDMRDNWCVGYSSRYTVGVWVGNFSGYPMRDVSGISGAAPVWAEIMSRLHRDDPGDPPATPAGLVADRVTFPEDRETPRTEWFLAGTNPGGARQLNRDLPRIAAPVAGTRIAIDPDMPPDRQRLSLQAHGAPDGARWILDEKDLGLAATPRLWAPVPGRHALSLVDTSGKTLDEIQFSVRGSQGQAAQKAGG